MFEQHIRSSWQIIRTNYTERVNAARNATRSEERYVSLFLEVQGRRRAYPRVGDAYLHIECLRNHHLLFCSHSAFVSRGVFSCFNPMAFTLLEKAV